MKVKSKLAYNWLALQIHDDFFHYISDSIKGCTVVDFGSGSQPYKGDIELLDGKYISVDWPGSFHNTQPSITADLNHGVDLASSAADIVISFSVLEHLHRPQTMLAEACRVLKPGGSLFMQVPFQWAVHEAPFDYARYTRFGLEKMLLDAGFESISIKADCGYWVTAALKFNYHTRRFIRGPKLARWIAGSVMAPFYYVIQVFCRALDRFDMDENETASYTVSAKKPNEQITAQTA